MWWILASLIFLGILLLLAEVLLVPGVGVAGILGLLSLTGSCWYAFEYYDSHVGKIVIIINILLCIAFLVFVLRAKTWKRFALNDSVSGRVNEEGKAIQTGEKGRTITRLGPIGNVRFGDITCEARSEGEIIDAGTEVTVTKIESNRIFVKPVE